MFIVSPFRALRGHLGFVAGLALLSLSQAPLVAQTNSPSAADGFDPNVDGTVFAVATQADGKILVAGTFPNIGGVARNNIARVNTDGSVDAGFNPNVNGQVNAVAIQADGRIIIAGYFTTVQANGAAAATVRNHIARLNADGSLDPTFDPNLGGTLAPEVETVVVQSDGRVVAGGTFTTAQPNGAATATVRNRIARFNSDGSLDTTFDPNVDRVVLSMAQQADGKIIVGGGFTMFQPNGATASTSRLSLARLNTDGTLDTSYNPNPDNGVTKVVVQTDGKVIAAGYFLNVQPNGALAQISRTHLARFNTDGTVDLGFNPAVSGNVLALTVQANGGLLFGGTFTTVQGYSRNYVARLAADGTLDTAFNPSPNYTVFSIAEQADGGLVLGGNFTQLQPNGAASATTRNHLARVNPDGTLDANFSPDTSGRVLALLVQPDGKALVGGSFTSIAGVTRNYIARLNADGSLDTSFDPNLNGQVTAMALQSNGQILVGGSFTTVKGAVHSRLVRLNTDGSIDASFNPTPDGQVTAIAVQSDGKILAGGAFVTFLPNGSATPTTLPHLARINTDGSLDITFAPQPTGSIYALVIQSNGQILVGGNFTGLATGIRGNIARLNTDGTLDPNYNPNANRQVNAILIQSDGKVILGGSFTYLQPTNAPTVLSTTVTVTQPNGTSTVTTTTGTTSIPTNTVPTTTTTTAADGTVTVTTTSPTTTSTRAGIARLNTDGTVDTSYDPNPNNVVRSLTLLSNGQVLMGGLFTQLAPNGSTVNVERNYFARINTSGTLDTTLDLGIPIGVGTQIITQALQADGKVLIGGSFTTLQPAGTSVPVVRNQLARINADGSLDTSYAPSAGGPTGAVINSLAVQADGRILVGGAFSAFGGTSSSNLVRFNSESVPDTSFNPNVDGPVNAVGVRLAGGTLGTQLGGFAWLNADGTLKTSFASGAQISGQVNALVVQADGKVVLGGTLTNLNSTTGNFLMRFNPDGTLDTSYNPSPDGVVNAMVLQSDGKIVIGGNFLNVQPNGATTQTSRTYVARINTDGTLDTTFDPKPDGLVKALAIQSNGSILIGGSFTSLEPNGATNVTNVNYLARVNADGTYDSTLNLNPNSTIYAIGIQTDGSIVIGGSFSTILSSPGSSTVLTRNHVARIKTDNSVDATFDPNTSTTVLSLAIQPADGKIVLGGYFTFLQANSSATIITRNYVARVNTDGTLDTGFNPNANAVVSNVAVQADGKVLLGGSFTTLQPNGAAVASSRNGLGRVNSDGSLDASFDPNPNGVVSALVANPDGTILVGGPFTTVEPTGSVLVGGSFATISGVAVSNLALLNTDGTPSGSFLPNPNGAVYALAIRPDSRMVVAGTFTSIGGVARQGVAQLNLSGSIDTTFNSNATASGGPAALLLQPDGKVILGGTSVGFGGTAHGTLERLNADGSLDTSFSPSGLGAVNALALQSDGRILVGSSAYNALVRLNTDGTTDATFNPAANGAVNSLLVQSNGQIIVGGSFTSIGGAAVSYLARLNANGTADTTFNPNPSGSVTALALQPSGKVLVGGSFSSVGGQIRYNLARITASTPALQSLAVNNNFTTITWTRGGSGAAVTAVNFDQSSDGRNWTSLGAGTRVGSADTWQLTGQSLTTGSPLFLRARGVMVNSRYSSLGVTESVRLFYSSTVPGIFGATTATGTSGSAFYYGVATNVSGATFSASGLPTGLSIDPVTGIISGTTTQTGLFPVTLTVTNSAGTATATLVLVINAPGSSTLSAVFVNLSARAQVTTTDPLIAGLVIGGTSSQTVLLRAIGPGLGAYGVTTAIANPRMRLYSSSGAIVSQNTGWGGSSALSTIFNQVGAFPLAAGSADAAMLVTLAPGSYSVVVDDVNGASGVALAEVYATTTALSSPSHLVNLSARSTASSGQTTLIGGFVVSGTAAKRVLIRGVGPTLASYGVSAYMPNPTLSLYDANSVLLAQNTNWNNPTTVTSGQPAASAAALILAASQAGAFPFNSGSADSAIIVTLAPGTYSAQVTGTAGTALVEVYELP